MIFLISLALTALFVRLCAKSLKEHASAYYLAATAVSVAVVACTVGGVRFPEPVNTWIWPLFSRSALATALFAVVMWTGALPNGSAAIKKLMPLRGELSILACILTLGHNAAYGKTYFRMLFTRPERLPANQLAAAVCSAVLIAIMLPLFITSFKSVRRKMDGRSWKRLQRFAYGFYALLYLHVMLLTVPYALEGRISYAINLLVYSVVFLGYAFCRVLKYQAAQKKDLSRLPGRQKLGAAAALVLSLCLTMGTYAYGGNEEARAPQAPSEEASQTEQTVETDKEDVQNEVPSADPGKHTAAGGADESEVSADASQPEEPEQAETPEEQPVQQAPQTESKPEPQVKPEQNVPAVQPAPAPEPKPAPAPEPKPAPASEPKPAPAPEPKPAPASEPKPAPEPVRVYKDGTFTGTGEGYMDYITVSVTIQSDVITNIAIVSSADDEPYFSDAKGVISQILTAQSANVDTVSGATFSSEGIINGVKAALASAKN